MRIQISCTRIGLMIGLAVAALAPGAAQAWTESVLYTFKGDTDGATPNGGLVSDTAGNLYGTTVEGGSCGRSAGCGTVFKLAPDGTKTILYTFPGRDQGALPQSGVILDSRDNLYGTTDETGAGECRGTIYTITHKGGHRVLYTFAGGTGRSRLWRGVSTAKMSGCLRRRVTIFKSLRPLDN